MNTSEFIASALNDAHGVLAQTVADLTDAQLHWTPPGTATPIGASYAHVIVIEDMFIAGMTGATPLYADAWAGRTGLSEAMPEMGPGWADPLVTPGADRHGAASGVRAGRIRADRRVSGRA